MALLQNTNDLRNKLIALWQQVDKGTVSASEVRVHINLARAILDSLKVEIAAAHLATRNIPAVPVQFVDEEKTNAKQKSHA